MLKELKNKSSPNFDLVFGSGGESTLMFTIDTTGSMSAEIYAARQMVSAIIDVVKEQPVDCIVAPFNDPSTYSTRLVLYLKLSDDFFFL